MYIDLEDQTQSVSNDVLQLLQQVLAFAAQKEQVADDAEVSLTLVDNQTIQEINRDYRQKDQVTDVISFAMQERHEDEIDIIGADLPVVLGDIIISVDQAKEQALTYGHSFEREMCFLAVHGFLHLLGYDHMNEADEKEMIERQEEILGEFGLER